MPLIPKCLLKTYGQGPLDHMFDCSARGHFVLKKIASRNTQTEKYFLIQVYARAKVKGVRPLIFSYHLALLTV